MTPSKDHNATEIEKVSIIKSLETPMKRKTKQELRDLWKKAINQQVILIRMEKENAKLRGKILFLYFEICHTNFLIIYIKYDILYYLNFLLKFQNVKRRLR